MQKVILFLAVFIVISSGAFAASAPGDSLYMSVENDGEMAGWFSVRSEAVGEDVVYTGRGVLGGTDKVFWEAKISSNLSMPKSMVFKGRMRGSNVLMDVQYNNGEVPTTSFTVDGNKYPAGDSKKMPKRFILIPQMMPSGFAILSDYLSAKDPSDYSGKFPASTMLGKMDLIIEGDGKQEVEIGGDTVSVRSFQFTLSHKDMEEDVVGRLDQFEDGSFCGVRVGEEVRAYVVSAPEGGAEEAVNEVDFTLDTSAGELDAKLVLPEDASAENPAPLVIFCNGLDSDANSFSLPKYLSSELADKGVASVVYSVREDSITAETVIKDAVLACTESNGAPGTVKGKVMLFSIGGGVEGLSQITAAANSDSLEVSGYICVGGNWVTVSETEIFTKPMLLLHGALDAEFSPEESTVFKAKLNEAGNMKVSCNVINGANHYLQKAKTGKLEEYESLAPECVMGVVDRMAQFILNYSK